MADFSTPVKNGMLNAIETVIGPGAKLEVFTGSKPAIGAADTGTKLASMALPSDYFSDAVAAVKSLLGTWRDSSADASGDAGYYRLKDSAGTATGVQGTVSDSNGSGELKLNTVSIVAGNAVVVTGFDLAF